MKRRKAVVLQAVVLQARWRVGAKCCSMLIGESTLWSELATVLLLGANGHALEEAVKKEHRRVVQRRARAPLGE